MQPRPTAETLNPLNPNTRYSISITQFCVPYHIFDLLQSSIEETLLLVERTHLRHLPVGQFKVENPDILFDIIRIRCARNGREPLLNVPAKNYLCSRLACDSAIFMIVGSFNNAPLLIAPPNGNQQVMWIP